MGFYHADECLIRLAQLSRLRSSLNSLVRRQTP